MSSQCCSPSTNPSKTSCCDPSASCCPEPSVSASGAAPSENEAKSMVAAYYTDLTTHGGTADLKTAACCVAGGIPKHLRKLMSQVADEVTAKFYGCGSPIPPLLDGCTVLDLGCGTGRDCFVLSKLVGASGSVIGLDMTPAQLEIANKYIDFHTKKWGYDKPNISFRHGFIEDLATAGIADGSVDVVVSNCVINLSANKEKVFKEIARVLKPGGELYFSDVFADRRIPKALQQDAVLLGECLSGALYIEDFRRMLAKVGLNDYRVVSRSVHDLGDPAENAIAAKIGHVTFYSLTIRSFKIAELEDRCEDYGQVAYYKGTIPGMPHSFELDDHHCLRTNYPMPVCSNTALMLGATRYRAHFTIHGDTSTHFGLFDCSSGPTPSKDQAATKSACC